MAQSASDKADQLAGSSGRKQKRKNVKAQISALETRFGGDLRSAQRVSGLREVARRPSVRVNDYLLSLMHPEKYLAHIPDMVTFPRGVEQIRCVITASTWVDVSALEGASSKETEVSNWENLLKDSEMPSDQKLRLLEVLKASKQEKGKEKLLTTTTSDDTLTLAIYPFLNSAFNPYNGEYEMDGTEYSDEAWSVHNYTSWASTLAGYRVVSMSVNAVYIGPALSNQGQVAVACLPPFTSSLGAISFSNVAEYNFSFTGAARDGAYQIWTPGSALDFNIHQVSSAGNETSPLLVFCAKGLPLPEAPETGTAQLPVFRLEVTMNIETYSTNQMLTSTQKAGQPDVAKYNHALATMASAQHQGLTNGRAESQSSIYSQIANVAKSVGGFLYDNRQFIVPAAMQAAELFL